MPKVSDEYKKKKRRQILESAIKCFGEKGYQNTTIDDIVKDSKMSKGTVYNYFKNKEELYLTLFDQSANYALDSMQSELTQSESPEEKFRNLFKFYSNVNTSDENWLKMQQVQGEFWSNASRDEKLAELLTQHSEQFVDFIASIIDKGKRSGDFRGDLESEILAEIFLSLADGMIHHSLVLQEQYPYKELYKLAELMITSFVKPESE